MRSTGTKMRKRQRKISIFVLAGIITTAITIASPAEEMGGTGVWIVDRTNNKEPLKTGQVFPKSPAERAGIKPGWFLISVNRTNVANISAADASGMIRGPVGTVVSLRLADPTRGITNEFIVKRGRVILQNNSVLKIIDP